MKPQNVNLSNTDPEDIENLLLEVEKSFDIKFFTQELAQFQTFGELGDHIKDKITLENTDDCTSQQAFYKLRESIKYTLKINTDGFTPSTLLVDIFPRSTRKEQLKKIEEDLGFELYILKPPHFVSNLLLLLFLISFIALFFEGQYFNWYFGIAGLVLSLSGFRISNKIGIELDVETVEHLIKKMTREHYIKSRRNPATYNEREIETILTDWFTIEFCA